MNFYKLIRKNVKNFRKNYIIIEKYIKIVFLKMLNKTKKFSNKMKS